MKSRSRARSAGPPLAFDLGCSLVETMVNAGTRDKILHEICVSGDPVRTLRRLRDRMHCHTWKAGAHEIRLARVVKAYDQRTREEGFHVLHDWDGKADEVNEEIIPIDVLDYLVAKRGHLGIAAERAAQYAAVLLDYYLVHLLALLSVRIWDEGDPDANLNRIDSLLHELQGSGGRQQFVENAETLILIATSHFELHERGYHGLLDRVRALNQAHRLNIALGHAASMGSHLRFGLEATYGRDTVVMRDDNVADYPWLCFSLMTLMKEYSALHDARIRGRKRETVVEALLNGLSPDARAFIGRGTASLSSAVCQAERSEFRDCFHAYRRHLTDEFEAYRPSGQAYSPLSFFFNFSHNVVKGSVIDAILRGVAWQLRLNDLLTGIADKNRPAADGASKLALASTLMEYARRSPDRICGRLMPVIVYDPQAGHRVFSVTMRKIGEP